MSDRHSWDRRLGLRLRRAAGAIPGGRTTGTLAAEALAPAFEALVLALLLRRESRSTGVAALAVGAGASLAALAVRDAIGRPRPGERADSGFPSRHAAASVAIARAVGRRRRGMRPWLAAAAGVGLAGRIVAGQHDPADIAAGAALGWSVDRIVEHAAGPRR